jgi:Transposase IS116/IS110/IS902 family
MGSKIIILALPARQLPPVGEPLVQQRVQPVRQRRDDLMGREVETHFGRHSAAEIICSQPGLGMILGAPVLAEFGDAPDRYATAKHRKNYAGTSPLTRPQARRRLPVEVPSG